LFLLGEDKPFIISDETPKEEESWVLLNTLWNKYNTFESAYAPMCGFGN
jgi:hypothetical protein